VTYRAAAGGAVLAAALLAGGCTSDTRYGGSGVDAGAGAGGPGGSGGATGGAGAPGTAGTGGAAGVDARGGAGGTAPGGASGAAAGGSTGLAGGAAGAGTGGAGGVPAAGGSGGAPAAGGAGGAATTLALTYATSSATATVFAIRIANAGPATPLISTIRARYFFSDDSTNKMNAATLDSATWHLSTGNDVDLRASGGCAVISTYPAAPASAYADVGCALTAPLNASDSLTFSIHFDPNSQAAANDYSYLPTGGAFQPNPHMLLLQNGLIVSGTAPF
jgi:hypothetical protein